MINQISQTHPCSGKCKRFNGEQCNTCLIPEPESDFMVGDQVVFTDASCFPGDLLTITEITKFEISLSNGMSIRHDLQWLRPATLQEVAIGRRIDSNSLEFEGNKNQRPDYLFDKEPTAREALMEFMRFPGNAQPYCPACTKKDYDMRVLRTLQAETVYVLEGKIMLRDVALGLLLIIVVLLAVALWSAL